MDLTIKNEIRKTLHNDQRINPRRYNNLKYLHTEHSLITMCKETANNIKRKIDNNIIIAVDFNTPLTAMDRSPRQKINMETQALNDTAGGLNRYLQNIPSKSSRIHILLKCTQNIF